MLVKLYLVAVDGIPEFIVRLACRRFVQGLVDVSSLKFRPTPAEFAAECRRVLERSLERDRIAKLPQLERAPRLPRPRQPFRPFPKLWEAFAGEPETLAKLDNLGSFDPVFTASRLLATAGVDAARKYILERNRPADCSKDRGLKPLGEIAVPIDISDFPPAGATRAELREWDERQKGEEVAGG